MTLLPWTYLFGGANLRSPLASLSLHLSSFARALELLAHLEYAAKCFHICMQIAHFLDRLIYEGSPIGNAVREFGSIKDLTALTRDAIRDIMASPAYATRLFNHPFQVRFDHDSS